MNLLTAIPFLKSRVRIPRQVISGSWEESRQILEEDVNLFCWKRPIHIPVTGYLEKLLEGDLPSIVFHTDTSGLNQEIKSARSKWDPESTQAGDTFWKDVSDLILNFLTLAKRDSGTVHLKVIDNNSCAKFHTDGYSLRLFTTYYGRGTEWLPEKATNRRGLGKTNELIVKDPDQVQRMESFEVGILKGELPNAPTPGKGIVHRSPEIGDSGEKRIILRVDI